MDGVRDRRLIRWSAGLGLAVGVVLRLGAGHPQEPPGKRDASAEPAPPPATGPDRGPS